MEFIFGKNQIFSCLGASSLIYANLKNSFAYVGVIGSAGSSLSDYTQITWPTIDPSLSVLLNIYYVKVGAEENPQYYIVNMTAQSSPTTL